MIHVDSIFQIHVYVAYVSRFWVWDLSLGKLTSQFKLESRGSILQTLCFLNS